MDLSGVGRPIVAPVRTDPTGVAGPTPDAARGRAWRRTSRGLYVPADVDGSGLDQRVAEAAAVLAPGDGGVTGWAALGWSGGRWFDGAPWGGGDLRPVALAIGGVRAVRPQHGIQTSEERLDPAELMTVAGLRVTAHVRSVCFEMRYAASERLAVVALDMAAFNDLASVDEVADYARTLNGWTGIPRCRAAIPKADENSWSPRETVMRLVWTLDAGLPRPRCNVPVFDYHGRHLGTPDLIDPEWGVVGEYDGALHLQGAQRSRDLHREELFRSHGLEYVTMLAGDPPDPTAFVRRLTSAYSRAADIPADRRRWTLERPSWWHDTTTVTARRSLDLSLRDRLLRHRAA